MSMQWLLLVPVAGVALQAALVATFGPSAAMWFSTGLAWQSIAGLACVAAAAAFRPRDWLWRAWVLNGISFLLPVFNKLTTGPEHSWLLARVPGRPVVELCYILVVNVASVGGCVLYVSAFAEAGLAGAISPARRRASIGVAVVVAAAIGLPTLVLDVRAALAVGGISGALGDAISDLADASCFALVAPLAGIAVAFRGGALAWPFGFLAASNLGWLGFDAATALARAAGAGPAGRVVSEAVLCAACLSATSAAVAQRRAIASVAPAPALAPRRAVG
jgi:hypothetical protein